MTILEGKKRNRWMLAVCAVGIHLSIGSIYAWSQIAVSITKQFPNQWSLVQITLCFSIAIVCLGIATLFLGHFVDRKGPKVSGIIAACLFGAGLVGGGIAIHIGSIYLLYLTYGVLGGFGIGLGYITPVSTLLKWFPDRRGLAMGLTIMGFGFGAAIEVLLLQNLFPALGITSVATGLIIIGAIYFIAMFLSSLYLAPPPKGWLPKGFTVVKTTVKTSKKHICEDLDSVTAYGALGTKRFYYLWVMLFINVCAGIALISVAKFMGEQVILLTSAGAAIMVIFMSPWRQLKMDFTDNYKIFVTLI
jgi:MFS transporter, OFA family, oxalate/formate antiporter